MSKLELPPYPSISLLFSKTAARVIPEPLAPIDPFEAYRLHDTVAVEEDLPSEVISFPKVKAWRDFELNLETSARNCFDVGRFGAGCGLSFVVSIFWAYLAIDKDVTSKLSMMAMMAMMEAGLQIGVLLSTIWVDSRSFSTRETNLEASSITLISLRSWIITEDAMISLTQKWCVLLR